MNQIQTPGFDYDGLPRSFIRAARKRIKRIEELDRETGRNVIEMGRLLKEQRDAFGTHAEKSGLRGGETWDAWVQQECGWSKGQRYANRLIKIFDVFGGAESAPRLGFEIMRQLSTDSTPAGLVDKVVQMAKDGEMPSIKQVRDMKKQAVQNLHPTPTDAKMKAQATGEPQIASDGRIYTPLADSEADDYTERRDRTYGSIDAINELATLDISPREWLESADEHWLSDLDLSNIERANDWLVNLIIAYKQNKKIIDGK